MKGMEFFWKGVLAGVCIGLGGTIYLKVGGVAGACLFAFGLIAVVSLGLNLFTGKAQFVWAPRAGGYGWLAAILGLNIVGCLAVALAVSTPDIQEKAVSVITGRLTIYSTLRNAILAIGCGFIMTLAVQNAAKQRWLPLLFGIPAFILCSLPHCVADAYYICVLPADYLIEHAAEIAPYYLAIVAGNFLGCNAYRLVAPAAVRPQSTEASRPSSLSHSQSTLQSSETSAE